MEKLKFRLEILKNSGVIDEEIYRTVTDLIIYLNEKWGIILTEDNGAMFITHLSMALKRIKKGESVNNVDYEVFQEILMSDKITEIEKIYEDIEKNIFNKKLPEEEKKYILINLLLIEENK
ncbi:PRD domain-containing protein [Leptotrichia sp. OH3620_COT-345]|uniref:PRD domain-containing protein n=1 Tax=Leptotrichia sp. OH3620_COT-345 TaxID=2491048 RepID=UPI000F654F72|nr:PRD domain-containing protein [Leptotrichia sp. OH3620_COT-345]RRD39999.1 PRD domain-containing protein [Leptotrichia sp. OH3620_COT-345]